MISATLPGAVTLADRFDTAMAWLLLALHQGARLHPVLGAAAARVFRARVDFARLTNQIARKTLPAAPNRREQARPEAATTRQPSASPRGPRQAGAHALPRGFGWLIRNRLVEQALQMSIRSLIEDPEMKAVVDAAPDRATRILRPLCRMLGVTPPPGLFARRQPPVDAAASANTQNGASAPAADGAETSRAEPTVGISQGDASAMAEAPDGEAIVADAPDGEVVGAEFSDAEATATATTHPKAAGDTASQDTGIGIEAPTTSPVTASLLAETPSPELALLRQIERGLARPRPDAVTTPSPPPDWALAWRPADRFINDRMRYMRVFDISQWPPDV